MKKLVLLALTIGLAGCGDFVDDDGDTSIRQFAQGLQSLGDRVAELGEAIQRDADVEAVPWSDLMSAIPDEVDGVPRVELDGDDARDKHGAGLSIAHAKFVIDGDSMFVGVADLGALRSGASLALRWVAPLFKRGDIEGDTQELEVEGYPAILIDDDDDGDRFVALLVEGRFAVIAGSDGRENRDFVWEALGEVDYRRLERWVEYGRP
ncbi:MAG: hypothetical protein OEN56_13375 [Gemmatimonadota bacterium]|nr:hypothetical protein [Gemmatimonadota bacterium]MDH3424826.1 hypothetical protein [Gemmatimonadota bacterium]